jgi:hypothetical protein
MAQYEFGEPEPEPTPPVSPLGSAGDQAPAGTPSPAGATPADTKNRTRRADGTYGHSHPNYLIEMAKSLGLSEDEIASTDTAALGDSVRLMSRQREHFQERLGSELQVAQQLQRDNERLRSGAPAPRPAEELHEESDGFPLDVADYDGPLIKVLRHVWNECRTFRGLFQQQAQAQQNETVRGKFDRAIQQLGSRYEPLLGKGRIDDLDADGAEFARRRAVAQEAIRLAGPNASADQIAQKFPAAVQLLYPIRGQAAAPAPQPPATNQPSEADWAQAGLALPRDRGAPPEPRGEKRAVEAVRRFQQEASQVSVNGATVDESDFLG